LMVTFFPYQWALGFAAMRSVWRELRGKTNWEKTAHVGAHRQRVENTVTTVPPAQGALSQNDERTTAYWLESGTDYPDHPAANSFAADLQRQAFRRYRAANIVTRSDNPAVAPLNSDFAAQKSAHRLTHAFTPRYGHPARFGPR
jgi:hypothetical protein